MVVLAFVAVLWLARGQLNTQYALYNIYYIGPVSGLRAGSPVEYSGVPVGRVSEVVIDPSNVERIRVTVEIEANVPIKSDAAASVETNILSGVSYIQISGGTQEAPILLPQPGQRYAVIRARRSRLASVTARAPQLLEKLNQTADQLNELLNEDNRKALADTLQNVRHFSATLDARSQDIAEFATNAEKAVQSLTVLLDDIRASYNGPDGLGNKAGTALTDFDKVARGLGDTNKQLQAAIQDVRPGLRNFSQQTLSDIGTLVGDARQLIASLTRLSGQIGRDPSQILFGDRREGYRPK